MSRSNERSGVHRLVDMVVEEVSLVDRAANQRRFLLVKRSEEDVTTENESDETDQDHEPDGDDTTEGGENADAGDAGEPSSAAAGAPTAGGTAASSRPAPAASSQATTEAVVAALEAMSGVVEMLATQATTEKAAPKKPPRPPQADEDDDESDELDDEEDDADEDEEPAPPPRRRGRGKPAPTRRTKADEPIAQVKAALGRLEALIRGGTRAPAASAPSTSTTPDLAAQLDGVHKAITELKTLVTGQAERLRTVEKNVGLPASRAVEGQRGKAKADDVSWPLDLNQPVDREHVDKSVSFHD